jgi:hypothetical protein
MWDTNVYFVLGAAERKKSSRQTGLWSVFTVSVIDVGPYFLRQDFTRIWFRHSVQDLLGILLLSSASCSF